MEHTEQAAFQVWINGESRSVPPGTTLSSLLKTLGIEGSRVAIELDRNIIRAPDWPATPVACGAKIEIVQFVGGG